MTLTDLYPLIERDYRLNDHKATLRSLRFRWRHLLRLLGARTSLGKITFELVERYKEVRLKEKPLSKPGLVARATVNHEIGVLRKGLKLARRRGWLKDLPEVLNLKVHNTRRGFIRPEEFRQIRSTLEVLDPPVADLVTWLYVTGWRRSEATGLVWEEVARDAAHLPAERSKTRKPRVIPIAGALVGLIARRRKLRKGPFVFQREGSEIRSFRGSWRRACEAWGLAGRLVHDLRRSFARNSVLARVQTRTAMEIAGMSRSTFDRYAIIDEMLASEGLELVSALVG